MLLSYDQPIFADRTSMAYQAVLPVTIFVENGVSMNGVFGGILQFGAGPINIITFNINSQADKNSFFPAFIGLKHSWPGPGL